MDDNDSFIVDFYSQLSELKEDYERIVGNLNFSREKCQNITMDIRESQKKKEFTLLNINEFSHKKSEGIENTRFGLKF